MKLKKNTTFGKESTRCFKISKSSCLAWVLKSLTDFHFNGLLLSKVWIAWAKKVQRSCLSWHWRVMQNLKKNWLVAWKMTWGILQIFTRALESVKIGTLIFLSKVENVWASNLQRSCVSWQWRVTQKFKRN